MEPSSLGLPEKGISSMAGNDDCSFLRKESLIYLRKLELILQGCCAKLPTRNRFNESASALLPEKFNMTDATGENLKCSFTLVGDNVAKAEITVRHPKLPSHFYRAVVQPDIQWKLQQVQDLGNYVLLAMEMLRFGMLTLHNCKDNELSVEKLFWVTTSIRNYLFAARDVFVYAPKKGPFSQIHDERLKKCFVPLPPADLIFNLYISSSKLNFNVIYSPAQPSEKDSLQVYECDCHVPWFADLIYIVTSAIQLTQLFIEKTNYYRAFYVFQVVPLFKNFLKLDPQTAKVTVGSLHIFGEAVKLKLSTAYLAANIRPKRMPDSIGYNNVSFLKQKHQYRTNGE